MEEEDYWRLEQLEVPLDSLSSGSCNHWRSHEQTSSFDSVKLFQQNYEHFFSELVITQSDFVQIFFWMTAPFKSGPNELRRPLEFACACVSTSVCIVCFNFSFSNMFSKVRGNIYKQNEPSLFMQIHLHKSLPSIPALFQLVFSHHVVCSLSKSFSYLLICPLYIYMIV